MAAITICSDFGAQKNKVSHCFHCFSIYFPWSDRTRCHDLHFLNVELKTNFSLSSFTFIKRLFTSSLSAIRVVSSAYLRLNYFSRQSWVQPAGKPAKQGQMILNKFHLTWRLLVLWITYLQRTYGQGPRFLQGCPRSFWEDKWWVVGSTKPTSQKGWKPFHFWRRE